MPPKRKAAAKKATAAKKAKSDNAATVEPAAPSGSKVADKIAKLKAETKKKSAPKVDSGCTIGNAGSVSVYEDYAAMLNQTNIGNNNNKFYIIQILEHAGGYWAWNRWGRVGEHGMNSSRMYTTAEEAIKDFEKKFRDKTKTKWEDRENFVAVHGKYTLLEMDDEEEEESDDKVEKLKQLDATDGTHAFLPSYLDVKTQALLSLIFDNTTFQYTMKELKIDTKKMPLGKLSKTQLAKGYETLEMIEQLIEAGGANGREKERLCSQFYTTVPHDFGRQRPPMISTLEVVHKKYEMLNILADVEMAQEMKQEQERRSITKGTAAVPHHLDIKYELLNCDLELLDRKSDEFKLLQRYTDETKGEGWRQPKVVDIWKVNRHAEDERFKPYDKIDNRKLLWHGTNVAVVAAILKTGLRIMPHSGGRVGRGIYFASENGKSAGYVGLMQNKGIMFLNEVVLGNEFSIQQDDSSLKSAPVGYDSVVARGRTEPAKTTTVKLDGRTVHVPQGKPKPVTQYANSSFSQSEYLVYKESQNRIRYLLLMDF